MGNVGIATCVVDVVGRDVATPADDRADASNFKATCLIVGLSPYSLASVTSIDEPPIRIGDYNTDARVVDAHGIEECKLESSFVASVDKVVAEVLKVASPGNEVCGPELDTSMCRGCTALTLSHGKVELSNSGILVVATSTLSLTLGYAERTRNWQKCREMSRKY